MAEAFYIRVPLDDLEQPHWRCLQAEDGGDGAIVLALRLRGLAAKSNRGGLIVRHTGEPMPLLQLATYLGHSPQHLEHRLRLLAKYGLATAVDDEEGGIRVVDPVLDTHFGRLAPPVLPAEPPKWPNQRYSRPLTAAERKRLTRTGQLPDGVQRLDMSRHTSHLAVTSNVTSPAQHTDVIGVSSCHVTDSISSSSNSTSSYDDDLPDITPLLRGIPPAERNKITPRIRKCLNAGHSLHTCQQAIDDARVGATAGRSWLGLAHHKLVQLAATPPLSPRMPPPPQTAVVEESSGGAVDTSAPWEVPGYQEAA